MAGFPELMLGLGLGYGQQVFGAPLLQHLRWASMCNNSLGDTTVGVQVAVGDVDAVGWWLVKLYPP